MWVVLALVACLVAFLSSSPLVGGVAIMAALIFAGIGVIVYGSK